MREMCGCSLNEQRKNLLIHLHERLQIWQIVPPHDFSSCAIQTKDLKC